MKYFERNGTTVPSYCLYGVGIVSKKRIPVSERDNGSETSLRYRGSTE